MVSDMFWMQSDRFNEGLPLNRTKQSARFHYEFSQFAVEA
jgi:hypothetical protein